MKSRLGKYSGRMEVGAEEYIINMFLKPDQLTKNQKKHIADRFHISLEEVARCIQVAKNEVARKELLLLNRRRLAEEY